MHDKLTITLIGKEVNKPKHKNNISSAINKTIIQSNNIKYNQINTSSKEENYSLVSGTKQKFSTIKRTLYIKHTVWPEIISRFTFFGKSFTHVSTTASAKYKLGHFEDEINFILSEDTFTDEEKSNNTYLSNKLTYE